MPVNGINGGKKVPKILPAGKPCIKRPMSTQIVNILASIDMYGYGIPETYNAFSQRKKDLAFPKTQNQLRNGNSVNLDSARDSFLGYIDLLQGALHNIIVGQTDSMSATTSQCASKIDESHILQDYMDNLKTLSREFQEKPEMQPFYQRLSASTVNMMVYKMYVCDTFIEKFFKKVLSKK